MHVALGLHVGCPAQSPPSAFRDPAALSLLLAQPLGPEPCSGLLGLSSSAAQPGHSLAGRADAEQRCFSDAALIALLRGRGVSIQALLLSQSWGGAVFLSLTGIPRAKLFIENKMIRNKSKLYIITVSKQLFQQQNCISCQPRTAAVCLYDNNILTDCPLRTLCNRQSSHPRGATARGGDGAPGILPGRTRRGKALGQEPAGKAPSVGGREDGAGEGQGLPDGLQFSQTPSRG